MSETGHSRYEFTLDDDGPSFELELSPHEFEVTLHALKTLRKKLTGTQDWRARTGLAHDDVDQRLAIVTKLMTDMHNLRRHA